MGSAANVAVDDDSADVTCPPCEPSSFQGRPPFRIAPPPPHRVAVAKHLCGCATDFALRSIVAAGRLADGARDGAGAGPDDAAAAAGTPAVSTPGHMDTVMVATCCHHRCTWDTYVNRPFLEAAGIDADDFRLLTVLSGWGTNGGASATSSRAGAPSAPPEMATGGSSGRGSGRVAADDEEGDDEHGGLSQEAARLSATLGEELDLPARRALGRMCKALLDSGRRLYLEQHGYTAALRRYCDEAVSPENLALVASRALTKGKGLV